MRQPFRRLAILIPFVALLLAPPPAAGDTVPALDPERGVMTMAPLLEKSTPAVVNISVRVRVPARENPLMRDPFFRRFFDLPERQPEREAMAAGSGVIVDADKGYVMTNHHVVEKAAEITVTLKDQRRFSAKLIGSDPGTDIALLRIRPEALSALPLGDSDRLKVGDLVIAVGNPFGLGQTVTSGIVSALGRGIGMQGYEDYIQTDASINPGNSGGALINSKGELIGINSAIIAPAGGNVGIGFAVPVNMARAVMDQLIRYGEVRRGRLGVAIQDLTPDISEALRIRQRGGAVVTKVEPGSPAAGAELKPGDVIVSVNGRAVRSSGDLRNRIGLVRAGESVRIGYYRDRTLRSATVKVAGARTAAAASASVPRLPGATFRDMSAAEVKKTEAKGALVAEVERGSPAWRLGLREGDVITAVNGAEIDSAGALAAAAEAERGTLLLTIVRDGAAFLAVVG